MVCSLTWNTPYIHSQFKHILCSTDLLNDVRATFLLCTCWNGVWISVGANYTVDSFDFPFDDRKLLKKTIIYFKFVFMSRNSKTSINRENVAFKFLIKFIHKYVFDLCKYLLQI